MSRYLERVENSARLVAVYGELLLDLPEDAGLDWSVALKALGMVDAYQQEGDEANELEFLLTDPQNIASVLNSLNFARENARTTRDIVPSEAWRAINELHIYAGQSLPSFAGRANTQVLDEIVGRCHEITGILEGTMSHGAVYQFVRLGRNLERADMISRQIDVAAATIMAGREELTLYESTIWRAVLRSLSAYQMYRQYVRRRILGPDVFAFLLHDPSFPRSIMHCMAVSRASLSALPRCEEALQKLQSVQDHLERIDLQAIDHPAVHRFADDLQLELASLHRLIFDTWLNPMRVAEA